MSRRVRMWVLVAVAVFFIVNVAGGIYAALLGEPIHAGVHTALTFLAIAFVMVLRRKSQARADGYRVPSGR